MSGRAENTMVELKDLLYKYAQAFTVEDAETLDRLYGDLAALAAQALTVCPRCNGKGGHYLACRYGFAAAGVPAETHVSEVAE